MRTSPEPAGTNCTYGGTKIETGIDSNSNGLLDEGEVDATATQYVCDTPSVADLYAHVPLVTIDSDTMVVALSTATSFGSLTSALGIEVSWTNVLTSFAHRS